MSKSSPSAVGASTSAIPAKTSPIEIDIRNVTKNYGSANALSDVSLEIKAGEFLTLLGPSGSGKSTLLMLLAGFEQPTVGDVVIGGRSMAGVPANRRNQGVVFQGYALFPHMTVVDNLAYPLVARGIRGARKEQLIERALARVRMNDFGARYPGQLSGGQQQRIALARAIVYEPPILLMDESLSALDRKLREEMQIELKSLHQELGNTIVYVTHDQDEALTMSDRVVVLSNGKIAQVGTPHDLYDHPSSRFVGDFVGESTLFEALVESWNGEEAIVTTAWGQRLRSAHSQPVAPGDHVLLLLRPERVFVAPAATAGQENSISGVVQAALFKGDSLRYTIQVQDQIFLVKEQRHAGAQAMASGKAVEIGFAASSLKIVEKLSH